jgi:type IV pilus assembly protein PilV
MKKYQYNLNKQAGSMLLEGLISVLLFSVGILAIVGLQAASIKMSGDAKYRSDANLLANELIGQMWLSDRTTATLQTFFSGSTVPGTNPPNIMYANWLNSVNATLPGVTGNAQNQPNVSFITDTNTQTHSSIATVVLYWSSPNEPARAHQHAVVAQISEK